MFETSDINIATYLKWVKKLSPSGHRYEGSQLLLRFDVAETEGELYKMEYINSEFSGYDATKRGFLKLLTRRHAG